MNTASYHPKQGFYVFESEVNNNTQWFVANIVNNDLYWYVKELVDLGVPGSESAEYPVGAHTFIAGISNNTEEEKDNKIIVDIPESDYYVWIERLKDEK